MHYNVLPVGSSVNYAPNRFQIAKNVTPISSFALRTRVEQHEQGKARFWGQRSGTEIFKKSWKNDEKSKILKLPKTIIYDDIDDFYDNTRLFRTTNEYGMLIKGGFFTYLGSSSAAARGPKERAAEGAFSG